MLTYPKGKLRTYYLLDSSGSLNMQYGDRILMTNIKASDISNDLKYFKEDLNQIKDDKRRSSYKPKPKDQIAKLTESEKRQIFRSINLSMSSIFRLPFLSNGDSALSKAYAESQVILQRAKDKEDRLALQTEIYNLLFNPRNYGFILGEIFSNDSVIGDNSLYTFAKIFEEDFYKVIRSREVTEMIKANPEITSVDLYLQIKASPDVDPFYKTAQKMGFEPFIGFVDHLIEKYLSR